jgi:beta-N-acetylhexosaminidase
MSWRADVLRLPALSRLAVLWVSVAVIGFTVSSGPGTPEVAKGAPNQLAAPFLAVVSPPSGGASGGAPSTPSRTAPAKPPKAASHSEPTGSRLAKDLGQLIVARFAGTIPTASILSAIRAGRIGAIILFSENTAGGVIATHTLVTRLQNAAVSGGNPRLLIMTDQEGGEVKRLPGPPYVAASQMANPVVAATEGRETAQLLRAAGVNVDLAPVADVTAVDGFITQEHRTFGNSPAVVANAACAFARSLAAAGVAYTLKHFPGLGDAIDSTDDGPVSVDASASALSAAETAYRRCGANRLALVMISSASYPHLTGSTPAVMSSATYREALRSDRVNAVTISDDFQAPAIANRTAPARTAIDAGLDMVMYAQTESAAEVAFQILYDDIRHGTLSVSRVAAAAADPQLALTENTRFLGRAGNGHRLLPDAQAVEPVC